MKIASEREISEKLEYQQQWKRLADYVSVFNERSYSHSPALAKDSGRRIRVLSLRMLRLVAPLGQNRTEYALLNPVIRKSGFQQGISAYLAKGGSLQDAASFLEQLRQRTGYLSIRLADHIQKNGARPDGTEDVVSRQVKHIVQIQGRQLTAYITGMRMAIGEMIRMKGG